MKRGKWKLCGAKAEGRSGEMSLPLYLLPQEPPQGLFPPLTAGTNSGTQLHSDPLEQGLVPTVYGTQRGGSPGVHSYPVSSQPAGHLLSPLRANVQEKPP